MKTKLKNLVEDEELTNNDVVTVPVEDEELRLLLTYL